MVLLRRCLLMHQSMHLLLAPALCSKQPFLPRLSPMSMHLLLLSLANHMERNMDPQTDLRKGSSGLSGAWQVKK